jgi:hypothetical protein
MGCGNSSRNPDKIANPSVVNPAPQNNRNRIQEMQNQNGEMGFNTNIAQPFGENKQGNVDVEEA